MARSHGDSRPNLEDREENFHQPVLDVSQQIATMKDDSGGGHTIIVRAFHNPRAYGSLHAIARRARHQNRYESLRVKCPRTLCNGAHGRNGVHGHNGSYGGYRGGDGTDGTPGRHGVPAVDSTFNIGGTPSGITGIDQYPNVRLGESNRSNIMIMAKGGCGGWGGHGGHGGDGGEGRMGTTGSPGSPGGTGQNGGDGGRGGDGGPGGNGGHAGDGKNGGNGGRGANVVLAVKREKSHLLMCFETDARGGTRGLGGVAGVGGAAGMGGEGGLGGPGGPGGPARTEQRRVVLSDGSSYYETVTVQAAGSPGNRGPSGSRGRDGIKGNNGRHGNHGTNGNEGTVKFQILDSSGKVLESGSDRYNAAVKSYDIWDGNKDGIFEPGEDGLGLVVRSVNIQNNGGLTLPAGSHLTFPSAGTLRHCKTAQLPFISKGASHVVKDEFAMSIDAVPCSVGRPHKHTERLTALSTMIGRVFDESEVYATILVQYPINFVSTRGPNERTASDTPYLGPNEISTIEMTIENISTRNYGDGKSEKSWGDVEVHLSVDKLFTILSHTGSTSQWSYKTRSATKAVATIHKFGSSRQQVIRFNILMNPEAGEVLMERLNWDTTLVLRGKHIEQRSGVIRVVPKYNQNVFTDAVLITHDGFDRPEFIAWSYLIQLLQLSVGLYDVTRYKGIGPHAGSARNGNDGGWLKRTNLMLVPRIRSVDLSLMTLSSIDAAIHLQSVSNDKDFQGKIDSVSRHVDANYTIEEEKESEPRTHPHTQGMLFLGWESRDFFHVIFPPNPSSKVQLSRFHPLSCCHDSEMQYLAADKCAMRTLDEMQDMDSERRVGIKHSEGLTATDNGVCFKTYDEVEVYSAIHSRDATILTTPSCGELHAAGVSLPFSWTVSGLTTTYTKKNATSVPLNGTFSRAVTSILSCLRPKKLIEIMISEDTSLTGLRFIRAMPQDRVATFGEINEDLVVRIEDLIITAIVQRIENEIEKHRTTPNSNVVTLPFCLDLVECVEAIQDSRSASIAASAVASAFSAGEKLFMIYCDPKRHLRYTLFDWGTTRASLLNSYRKRMQLLVGGKAHQATADRALNGPNLLDDVLEVDKSGRHGYINLISPAHVDHSKWVGIWQGQGKMLKAGLVVLSFLYVVIMIPLGCTKYRNSLGVFLLPAMVFVLILCYSKVMTKSICGLYQDDLRAQMYSSVCTIRGMRNAVLFCLFIWSISLFVVLDLTTSFGGNGSKNPDWGTFGDWSGGVDKYHYGDVISTLSPTSSPSVSFSPSASFSPTVDSTGSLRTRAPTPTRQHSPAPTPFTSSRTHSMPPTAAAATLEDVGVWRWGSIYLLLFIAFACMCKAFSAHWTKSRRVATWHRHVGSDRFKTSYVSPTANAADGPKREHRQQVGEKYHEDLVGKGVQLPTMTKNPMAASK